MPRAPRLAQSLQKSERDRFRAQNEELNNLIVADMEEYYAAFRNLALGVWVHHTTQDGEVRAYKDKPDGRALEYLINRVYGPPTQRLEVDHRAFVVEDFIRESAEKALQEQGIQVLAAPKEELITPSEIPLDGEVRILD